ncbi:hypothetical protein Q1695_015577 [Nippostrongylus brasiliensis]|nr:hypothetical protein Q1695_015577 [Nippostrongylus brasiliensis]
MDIDCSVPKFLPTELEEPGGDGISKYYYYVASFLMKFMVSPVPDESIQRIGRVLMDSPEKIRSALIFSIFERPLALLIFIAWLFLSIFLVLLLFLHFTCRTFYKMKEGKVSCRSMALSALAFVVCVITSVCGMILFVSSIGSVLDGVEFLPNLLKVTASDITKLTWHLNESVKCLREDLDGSIEYDVRKIWKEIERDINHLKQDFGEQGYPRTIVLAENSQQTMKNLTGLMAGKTEKLKQDLGISYLDAASNSLSTLITSLNVLSRRVNRTYNRVERSFRLLKQDISTEFEMYYNFSHTLEEVVAFVKNSTIETQVDIVDIFMEEEYAINVSSFLGYTLLFPLCLIAFSILGLAGILGSWKFSMGVDRYDYRRYRRGVVANAIGSVILSAAYSSIIICSALCFITAICFLLAFATMLICMGMFGDNDLRFLQTIPQLRHTVIIGDQVLQYSLHDIFRMCKNGHAFFNAINGSYSTVQSEVMKKFLIGQRYDVSREIRNFHVDPAVENQITKSSKDVKRLLEQHKQNVNEKELDGAPLPIKGTIVSLRSMLNEVTQRVEKFFATTSKLQPRSSFLASKQGQLKRRLPKAINVLFHAAVNALPQCDALTEIWTTFGYYVCISISLPTQGLWVACMICVIGSSGIYNALFNTGRFLHQYAVITQAIVDRRRMREAKYEYVRHRIDELGRSFEGPSSSVQMGSSDRRSGRPSIQKEVDHIKERQVEVLLKTVVVAEKFSKAVKGFLPNARKIRRRRKRSEHSGEKSRYQCTIMYSRRIIHNTELSISNNRVPVFRDDYD